ncbi:MAG: Cl- channel voltage-gated family protein [Candidatus Parabeggiatoa sp. nov. 1]|nr:MAG: Cl- channel voltage-gated family protein [Gammaproteobacteria bacterium]
MSLPSSEETSFSQPPPRTLLRKFKSLPNLVVITALALIVGIGAGFGAIFTEWLVEEVHHIFFETKLWGLLDGFGAYYLVIVPALGALIFAPIIIHFAREAKGHGVSEVLEAVSVRGGRIRPRVGIVKSLTSALCIGTGGSVGLEGPIAQIGSALGSTVGQIFTLNEDRIRLLLACGAGGGIAATFHAPITGTIFALELILGHLEAGYFSAVVISAVVADTIAQFYKEPFIDQQHYELVSNWELLLYAILGVAAGISAISFTKVLYWMEELWDRLPISEYLKPVLGGALLGIIGLITFFQFDGFPRFFGMGYSSINDALNGRIALDLILALFLLKIFTTSLTLGSGGTGGTFTPSLFMGAMLGGTFGHVVNMLFPTLNVPIGAYALAGMAAFFGGAAHAPMTAIMVAFELTGNYQLILPIMLATVISTLVAQSINPSSMYTLKLVRRGIKVRRGAPGHELDVIESVTVGDVMNTHVEVVPLTMPLFHLMEQFDQTHRHGFPVANEAGELVGVVSIRDLDNAIAAGKLQGRTVADIATKDILVAYPFEPMGAALQRLGVRQISRLPVVEEEGSRKLVGIVLRADIIKAYTHALAKRTQSP